MDVKRRLTILLAVFILPLLAFGGKQPEIRFNPEDFVYVYETNADKEYYNGMIHFIGFVNRGTEEVSIDRTVIDVMQDSQVRRRVFLTRRELELQAKKAKKNFVWHLISTRHLKIIIFRVHP